MGRSCRLVAAAALLVALAGAGCAGGGMGPMGPSMHDRRAGDVGPAPSPFTGAIEVVVVASEFAFEPSTLRVAAGEVVNITLDDRGRLYHDLAIAELGFLLGTDAGTRTSGALRVARRGRYEFVCTVPGHAAAGMAGTLIVG